MSDERDEVIERLGGEIATGGGTDWTDVYNSAVETQISRGNTNSQERSLYDAIGYRNKAIYEATGVKLTHPMDDYLDPVLGVEAAPQRDLTAISRWETELRSLADRRPDAIDVIQPDRHPMLDAQEAAQRDDAAANSIYDRYRGPWGAAGLASFLGSMRGSLEDPMTLATFWMGGGVAQQGIRGVVRSAITQGAINASISATMEPIVADWSKRAGLDYDLTDSLTNVGGAFLFGAGVDAVPRGLYRGVQHYRGRVPKLADDGTVVGYEHASDRLEREAIKGDIDLLGRAYRDGDADALRELAEKTGVAEHPEVRAALEAMDDIDATEIRLGDDVDPFEAEAFIDQAARAVDDPMEPLPVMPKPLPEPADLPAWALQQREAINSGDMSVPQMAAALRETPELVDRSQAPLPAPIAEARAIASLSEPAYQMVQEGAASPRNAAIVAQHIDDPAEQAVVLADLEKARPKNAREARRVLQAVRKPDTARQEAVTLYRGVTAGRDPASTNGTVGQARFMTPDRAVAEAYAGADGTVAAENVQFNNLLRVPTWMDGKAALGLPLSATMDDLVDAARRAGYDGLSFKTKNGDEYIQIPQPEAVPGAGARIDDPLGPEADRQIAALEAQLFGGASGADMAPAPVSSGMPPIPEAGAAPLRDSARGLLDGRSAPQFGAMERNVGVLMEALRDEGPDGVRRALLAMGRPAARDVAARLAGDKVLSFETMTPRQKVDLITARVLRRWSQALGDDPAAVQARELSDAIEAEAFPEAPPLDIERARAFGAKAADKPKVAHPVHAGLKLPLEKDGTVLMFRGDDPARPPKGKFGGRIFTTDLVRALRNAPAGDVMVVRVMPEELAQVDPRKTTVRGRPAVKPDESTFTLSEALAGRAKAFKDEPEMRARAAQAARGGLRDAGLKDLAGKTLQRATKRAAGAILKGLEAGIKDTVAHPKEAKLKLVLEDDGTVLMFQGRTAGKTPGPVGARVFTTDVERALRDSPEGDIRVVRVPKEQLKDADPRLTGGKIAAGEKVFVLSEELAGLAERMEGVPDMLRQAVRDTLDMDDMKPMRAMRSMDDVEMLLRMREVIEECKL